MEYFWAYLLLGAFAGFIAGLLGVGGGLLIVPVLASLFSYFMPDSLIMQMAIGTSLMSIIFTSLASIYAHHRQQKIDWVLVQKLSLGVFIGAILGAWLANTVPSDYLRYLFAVFELFVAWQLLFPKKTSPKNTATSSSALPSPFLAKTGRMTLVGGVIGFLSSLLGIGGGTMTTPFLLHYRVHINRAIATSAAVGLPIAIAGSLGFIIVGWSQHHLPELSLGYIYLPALLGILLTSMLFAPLGAKVTHRLPTQRLKKLFAALLILLAIKLLLP
ncbi:MAG: sulfite exporter TauE/SafE family protein [bacterium]